MTTPDNYLPSRRLALSGAALLAARGILSGAATPVAHVLDVRTISHQPEIFHGWPTLIRRANGELIVAWSGGREQHVCPFGRVDLMRSRDEGQSWSWPQTVLDTPIDDRDAGLLETPSGALLLTTFTSLVYEGLLAEATNWDAARFERWHAVQRATTVAQRQSLVGAWMLRSTDGGFTWQAPYRVPVTSPHGPIALRDGRLLYPGKEYPGGDQGVGVCESTDDGVTWRWLARIPARAGDKALDYHELHGVEVSSGHVVVHIRNHNPNNRNETLQTESRDGGRTWTEPRAIGVWGLPSHLLRLRDGRLLMSYSHRRAPLGNQARISEDGGSTWTSPVMLSDDGAGDLGYPSTVELSKGDLLSIWYEVRPQVSNRRRKAELRMARWSLS